MLQVRSPFLSVRLVNQINVIKLCACAQWVQNQKHVIPETSGQIHKGLKGACEKIALPLIAHYFPEIK